MFTECSIPRAPRGAGPYVGQRALRICLVGAALLPLLSCTQRAPEASPEPILRIGLGFSEQEQPRAQRNLMALLYAEPLVSFQWNGRLEGRVAEEWAWSEDGRTFELRLRKGVTLHDGRPVTAQSVVDILNRRLMETRGEPRYLGGFQYVERIDAHDTHTVRIALRRPDTFLTGELDQTLIVAPDNPDIGTGPFKIARREPQGEAVRFDQYYLRPPEFSRVVLKAFDSQRAAWTAFMRGDVDVVQQVARESVEFLKGASRVRTYSSIRPFYIPLILNLNHPVLRKPEVRRALNEAVDRDQVLRQALQGRGQVADDPVWPFHWAYSRTSRRYTHNPEAARLRLDAAGLPMRPPGKDGGMASRFKLNCFFYDGDPQFERIALLLQRQLAEVGIDFNVQPMDLRQLGGHAAAGTFDTVLIPLASGRSFEVTYRFWHSPKGDVAQILKSGYTGADEILERLRVVRNDADVGIAVADLQQRFYEDAPAVFLAWQEITRAVDARFDVGDRTDPDVFANLWRWRPVANLQGAR